MTEDDRLTESGIGKFLESLKEKEDLEEVVGSGSYTPPKPLPKQIKKYELLVSEYNSDQDIVYFRLKTTPRAMNEKRNKKIGLPLKYFTKLVQINGQELTSLEKRTVYSYNRELLLHLYDNTKRLTT